MKKVIVILSTLASCFVNAQIEKGTLLIGPAINYSQYSSNYEFANNPNASTKFKNSQLNAYLRIGYFVADRIVVGVLAGFNNTLQKDEDRSNLGALNTTTQKTNIVSAGLFARMYKLYNENRFGFFGEIYGTYGVGRAKTIYSPSNNNPFSSPNDNRSDIGVFNLGLRPGFVFFVTNKIGLEASIGNISFRSEKRDNLQSGQSYSTGHNTNLNADFGLSSFNLGVHFYLGKKKE